MENKKRTNAIKDNIEINQTTIDILPIPIFYKNTDGVYIGCNKKFEEFLGKSKDDIVGKGVFEISGEEQAAEYFSKDKELFDNPGVQIYEYEVLSKDDKKKRVRFYKTTFLNADGELGGLIGTIFDITSDYEKKELLEERNKLLERIYTRDSLTNLYNHKKILDIVEDQINISETFSIFMFDVDNFKQINDNYGHQIGDKALIKISETILSNVRKEDFVGRYGGEEFLIVFPRLNIEEALKISERLRREIAMIDLIEGRQITVSGGIAEFTDESLNALISKVDRFLYKVKKSGKNGIYFKAPK